MPIDIYTTLLNLIREGSVNAIAANPMAQLGTPNRQYLGATVLPERLVEDNIFREDSIRYRTVIANDGSRYSPAQLKSGNNIIGSMLVELGNSDIASQFSGREFDLLIRILQRNMTMEAAAKLIEWLDTSINLALIELIEKQRWEALMDGEVVRLGDNGFSETVTYPNVANHRATIAGDWTDPTYDIFSDVLAQAQILWDKGYQVNRIITSRRMTSVMSGNEGIARRTGRLSIQGTTFEILPGRSDMSGVNAALNAEGLPNLETYDLTYNTSTETLRFFPINGMLLVATTGRDETIETETGDLFLGDTLGYVAVGRAVGQAAPGRVIRAQAFDNKPPRIEAEGWQTSLPVIQDPEAFATLAVTAVS